MDCLAELQAGFNKIKNDPAFWEEYRSYYPFMGRPGQLHLAEGLTKHAGGANIWLKREDLNHTVSSSYTILIYNRELIKLGEPQNQQRSRSDFACQETG